MIENQISSTIYLTWRINHYAITLFLLLLASPMRIYDEIQLFPATVWSSVELWDNYDRKVRVITYLIMY